MIKPDLTSWSYDSSIHSKTDYFYQQDLLQDWFAVSTCTSWQALLLHFNSLAPGRFKVNFRWVIFKLILVVNGWVMSCETALIWTSLDHIYGKSTLVQVMAWCRQATSHYLSQCWPRSLSPYGATRPQWVNSLQPSNAIWGHRYGLALYHNSTKPLPDLMQVSHQ